MSAGIHWDNTRRLWTAWVGQSQVEWDEMSLTVRHEAGVVQQVDIHDVSHVGTVPRATDTLLRLVEGDGRVRVIYLEVDASAEAAEVAGAIERTLSSGRAVGGGPRTTSTEQNRREVPSGPDATTAQPTATTSVEAAEIAGAVPKDAPPHLPEHGRMADVAEALAVIDELRRNGALDELEHEAARNQILGSDRRDR